MCFSCRLRIYCRIPCLSLPHGAGIRAAHAALPPLLRAQNVEKDVYLSNLRHKLRNRANGVARQRLRISGARCAAGAKTARRNGTEKRGIPARRSHLRAPQNRAADGVRGQRKPRRCSAAEKPPQTRSPSRKTVLRVRTVRRAEAPPERTGMRRQSATWRSLRKSSSMRRMKSSTDPPYASSVMSNP